MKLLKIQNNGIIDIRLVALMGGTTKSNDEYKIGQFGTGLKYTLAWLLRNNLHFEIYAGADKIKIHTETETIRGEDFDIICINGSRTSITTRMGDDWKAWMIIRELWCNALDEGGEVRETVSECAPVEGCTVFYIQINSEIADVLKHWHRYFLHDAMPVCEHGDYKIYPSSGKLRIYKQGVLIREYEEYPDSVYAYDIKNATINELREYKGSPDCDIYFALRHADAHTIANLLAQCENKYEGREMDWFWSSTLGGSWREAIGDSKVTTAEIVENLKLRGAQVDLSGTIIVSTRMYEFLMKQFKGISLTRSSSRVGEFIATSDEQAIVELRKGLSVLEKCGYSFEQNAFVAGEFGNKDVHAKIDIETKTIYFSASKIKNQSIFEICTMLIEEKEHELTGHGDLTRGFQQHFINLYTKHLFTNNKIEL